ncbi:hypothetical protein Hanom_Chr01g00007141 [Helianthus anomalus]
MSRSAAVQEANFTALKWEVKCLHDNQLLMLQNERLKLKNELKQKIGSLEKEPQKQQS